MSKGITFYKLVSPYPEDITKGCGLVGSEIDRNFFNLKEMDIKSAYTEDMTLILERIDGEKIAVDLEPWLGNMTTSFFVEYDKDLGTITINHNGTQEVIDGLITENNLGKNTLTEVISDGTLYGKGKFGSPLKISPVCETGAYAPVAKLIDLTAKGTCLPNPNKCAKGDRFLTRENVNLFGYLYSFQAAQRIQSDLDCEGHGWRIPTKKDWDNMLNAIEPCADNKDHDQINGNVQCGKLAGKLLKSTKYWKLKYPRPCASDDVEDAYNSDAYQERDCFTHDCDCHNDHNHKCHCDHDHNHNRPHPKPIFPNGVDAFGMGLLPSGYGDGHKLNGYFGERATYWTSTESHISDVYIKRFDYDKTTVIQEIVNPCAIASIRLVKDYDGSNHLDTEYINGQDYNVVLMPAENTKYGFQLWTSTNVAFTDPCYNPIEPNDGLGLPLESFFVKYFINEWDGFKWVKKEMNEGESVVLKYGLNGEKYASYRLIDGELVSEPKYVYDMILEEITPKLDDLQEQIWSNDSDIEELKAQDEFLQRQLDNNLEKLEQEIQDRIVADQEILEKVNENQEQNDEVHKKIVQVLTNEKNEREETDKELWAALQEESNIRSEIDEKLQNRLRKEISDREEADAKLEADLETETSERIKVDQELSDRLDSYIKDNDETISEIQNTLQEEARIREEEDVKLYQALQEEAIARENTDREQWVVINNEIATREEEDKKLYDAIEKSSASQEAVDKEQWDAIENEAAIREEEDKELYKVIEKGASAREEVEKQLWDAVNNESLIREEEDKKIYGVIESEATIREDLDNQIWSAIETLKEASDKIDTDQWKAIEDEISRAKSEEARIEAKLDEEITRSTEKDAKIVGRLIKPQGSTFDCENGVLTLLTYDTDNTITIKLTSNYGTFSKEN